MNSTIVLGCLLSSLPAALLTTTAQAGGGWTREPGRGYAKLGLTTVNTTRYHTLSGQTISTARFRQQVYSVYGEYGIGKRLEATLNFPVFRRAAFAGVTPAQGIGDPEFGLRYGLLTGKWPLALAVAVEAPLGSPTKRGYSRADRRVFIALPTGDGEWNVWMRAALSHSVGKLPAYFTLSAGYNKRTRGFTDQYTYGGQFGYQVRKKAWLTATTQTLATVRPPVLTKLSSIGLGEGVAYSTAALGASYALTPHLRATTDWAVGFGRLRNVYSGQQFTVGAALEW